MVDLNQIITDKSMYILISHSINYPSLESSVFLYLYQVINNEISYFGTKIEEINKICLFYEPDKHFIVEQPKYTNPNSKILFMHVDKYKMLNPEFKAKRIIINVDDIKITIPLSVNPMVSITENNIDEMKFCDKLEKYSSIDLNKKILFFDTETNGVFNISGRKYALATYKQPQYFGDVHLLSIGWIIMINGVCAKRQYQLIKNPNIHNIGKPLEINKITDEMRNEQGVDISVLFNEFMNDVQDCSFVVAHGTDFDKNILYYEFINYLSKLNNETYESSTIKLEKMFENVIFLNTKQFLYKPSKKYGLSQLVSLTDEDTKSLNIGPHHALYDTLLLIKLFIERI